MVYPNFDQLVFYQFQDEVSKTYTYLIGDPESKQAVIIDPVREQQKKYLTTIYSQGLKLKYVLDTHSHADHITAAYDLSLETKALIGLSHKVQGPFVDIHLKNEEHLFFGNNMITVMETPGHTSDSMCFLLNEGAAVFTGDTLFIDGCGRADFQSGSPESLYESITTKLYTLSSDCKVYPGHDYNDFRFSSIKQEKEHNKRLNQSTTKEEFVDVMNNLNLPRPKLMDVAVPANLHSGK